MRHAPAKGTAPAGLQTAVAPDVDAGEQCVAWDKSEALTAPPVRAADAPPLPAVWPWTPQQRLLDTCQARGCPLKHAALWAACAHPAAVATMDKVCAHRWLAGDRIVS